MKVAFSPAELDPVRSKGQFRPPPKMISNSTGYVPASSVWVSFSDAWGVEAVSFQPSAISRMVRGTASAVRQRNRDPGFKEPVPAVRFLHTWKKVRSTDEYPRYESRIKTFSERLASYNT